MGEKFFVFKDGVDPAEYRREIIIHLDTSILDNPMEKENSMGIFM